MTDLHDLAAPDAGPGRWYGSADHAPSTIPAAEIQDLILAVNAELEGLQARVVEVRRLAELPDALVQLELFGRVQMDRVIEAAHAHAAALLADARATAEDLVLQAHSDRAARILSLEVPPRGPALDLGVAAPTPPAAGGADEPLEAAAGWSALDPAQEADEAERFGAFWRAEPAEGPGGVRGPREELVAIALGLVGAIVFLIVALAWVG